MIRQIIWWGLMISFVAMAVKSWLRKEYLTNPLAFEHYNLPEWMGKWLEELDTELEHKQIKMLMKTIKEQYETLTKEQRKLLKRIREARRENDDEEMEKLLLELEKKLL